MYREFDRWVDGVGWVHTEVEWHPLTHDRTSLRSFRMRDDSEIKKSELTEKQQEQILLPIREAEKEFEVPERFE